MLDIDPRFIIAMPCVNMRRLMIVDRHKDPYPVKPAYLRHSTCCLNRILYTAGGLQSALQEVEGGLLRPLAACSQ